MVVAIFKHSKLSNYSFLFCMTVFPLVYLLLNYANIHRSLSNGINTIVIKILKSEGERDESTTVGCTLPSLNPFDPSIRQFLEEPPPFTCTEKFPLLFTTDLNRTLIHHLESLAKNGYSSCCYTPFVRVDETNVKFLPECTLINLKENETEIPINIEFIRITCSDSASQSQHVDYFAFVPPPSILRQKITKDPEYNKKQEETRSGSKVRRPNVVILGLDATSHMSFQRTMPLTFKYLTQTLKARGMAGYNSNAESTFPNLVQVLTGRSLKEIEDSCLKQSGVFDDCPFIWKNFSDQGYRTALAEDATYIGIFRWSQKGFRGQPTDIYHHTLFTEMEKANACHGSYGRCYGPRVGFHVLLNLLKKMALQKDESHPYFQFMWATSIFHDHLYAGAYSDQQLLDTLTWFKEQGHLDQDTIFILMSDHGQRVGGIQSTIQGRTERRMPFLYFLFPPWFLQKFPKAVENLENNAKRLTSHSDLHETLKDLLFLQNIADDRIQERQNQIQGQNDLPRGISLFLPIPTRRTCKDAEIPEVWCVCRGAETLPVQNNTIVRRAAEHIVSEINKKLVGYPQCPNVNLLEVWSAQAFHQREGRRINIQNSSESSNHSVDVTHVEGPQVNNKTRNQPLSFFISLSASPGESWFEGVATLEINGTWTTSSEISRSDKYGMESHCVDDRALKLFCYCY